MARLNESQLAETMAKPWRNTPPKPAITKLPRHKFNAKKVEYDGIEFDSKLEGSYYLHLKQLQRLGDVLFFLRQVPIHLLGGTKLVIDFQVFYVDGSCRFIDTKGKETADFLIKKREIEALYPFKIEIVKKGDF